MRIAAPDETLRFLHVCIDSIEQLEALLLLAEDPAREWTVEAVTEELGTSPASVAVRLAGLEAAGPVGRVGTASFRYRSSETRDRTVAEIRRLYAERRTRPTRDRRRRRRSG